MMYNIFFATSYFSSFWLLCELVGLSFFSAICSQGHTGAAMNKLVTIPILLANLRGYISNKKEDRTRSSEEF